MKLKMMQKSLVPYDCFWERRSAVHFSKALVWHFKGVLLKLSDPVIISNLSPFGVLLRPG